MLKVNVMKNLPKMSLIMLSPSFWSVPDFLVFRDLNE